MERGSLLPTGDQPDSGVPAAGDAPRLALALLHEVWDADEALEQIVQDLTPLDRKITIATDRRRAARCGPDLVLACDALDELLAHLNTIDERAWTLLDVLGTPAEDDSKEVIRARGHVNSVLGLVITRGERGREYAYVGRLAAERISDFAEAEMRYEQIVRDLGRRDLEAVDQKMVRLAELERDLEVQGVTVMLARVRRRREEMATGGRGSRPGWAGSGHYDDDDDYTI